ncbi:MAG: diguanylate cyclase [Gammaproteobacteria bacterium]
MLTLIIMQSDNVNINEFHWMTVLLQSIDVGIVVLNHDYEIQVWNTFMENHSGLQPQEARNQNLFKLFPDIPEQWFRQKCKSVFEIQNHAFSTWQQRPYLFKFNNYRPITSTEKNMFQNFTILPVTSLTGEVESIAVIIYDVTDVAVSKKELEESNQCLTMQSRTDQLTQLYNRGYWELRVKQEFARFKRYGKKDSLIMFDIDHFKKVNDTYGHLAGDEVIRFVASSVLKLKRDPDIAGRYGGEEFGILLTDTSAENAFIFAERLRQAIASSDIIFEGKKINITISLGISEFNNNVDDYEQIVAQADTALYESKNNGRNLATIHKKTQLAQTQLAEVPNKTMQSL